MLNHIKLGASINTNTLIVGFANIEALPKVGVWRLVTMQGWSSTVRFALK